MKISKSLRIACFSLFDTFSVTGSSTMNDAKKISLCKLPHGVCQAIKMHIIVLRYLFGVKFLGTMYMKFLFCSVYVHKNLFDSQAWDLLENWLLFSSASFIANTVC